MKITREIKQVDSKHDFLRFQVGREEERKAKLPVYRGGKVIGHTICETTVKVFRLLGFGSTIERAQAMTARA